MNWLKASQSSQFKKKTSCNEFLHVELSSVLFPFFLDGLDMTWLISADSTLSICQETLACHHLKEDLEMTNYVH